MIDSSFIHLLLCIYRVTACDGRVWPNSWPFMVQGTMRQKSTLDKQQWKLLHGDGAVLTARFPAAGSESVDRRCGRVSAPQIFLSFPVLFRAQYH